MACGDGVKEALFVYAGLESLQLHLRGKPINILEDNEGGKH